MEQLPTISAWLKNKPDNNGLCPIMIRITFKRKLFYKTSGFKAHPGNFDPQALIGNKDVNAGFKNAYIRKEINDLERKFIALLEDGEIDIHTIKSILSGDVTSSAMTFKMLNLKVRAAYEHILSIGTINQYKAEATKIEKFKPGVFVHQINHQLLNEYHRYMKSDLKNSDNTVRKTLSKLHAIFEKAIGMKFVKENPLKSYKMPAYRPPLRKILTEDEQKRIVDYADNGANAYYRLVASWFVLQRYSGLRYSDLAKWNESEMVRNGKIYFKDEKEETVHYIPLYPELKEAIKRVRNLRSIPVNQDCNSALKEIAKLCDIDIRLTTHVARHTFAVSYLDNGGSLEVLQKLLGHESIKTTAIYGRISSKRINNETKSVWGQ